MSSSGSSGDVASSASGSNVVAPPVPTNVVLSSRLNPRAPSFNLPMSKVPSSTQQQNQSNQPIQSGGGPNNPPNSMAFHQSQQNQFGSIHQQLGGQQQYKGMGGGGGGQYPGINRPGMVGSGSRAVGGGSNPNHVGGWSAYGSTSATEDFLNFPLAALAASAGIVDMGVIPVEPMEPAPPKIDRALPRPIGGERAWKQNSNSGGSGLGGSGSAGVIGGLPGFMALDCMDPGPIGQPSNPLQIPSSVGGGGNPQQQNQAHWFGGLYPQSSTAAGSGGYSSQQQQGQQPPSQLNLGNHGPPKGASGDARNILGRRFMDEMDGRGIMELQQQV